MDHPFEKVADLPHIDSTQLRGRVIVLVPVWDGEAWRTWVPVGDGKLAKLSIVDVARSPYLAKTAAHEEDIYVPFLEFLWQHMSWPAVAREVSGIKQDVHLMATSAAKLEHFHAARDIIGQELITTFVNSEVEHLLVVARSTFDLLQAALAHFWKNHVRLVDPKMENIRRQRPMPPEFSKVVLNGDILRHAEQISERYSLPATTAAMYAKQLAPWLARLVGQTLEACSDIILSLNSQIEFPPPIAPHHRLFVRDPANGALMRLVEAAQSPKNWWQEAPITTGEVKGRVVDQQ